ncbi:2-succinyl-6-hydroxy-2,4-cyclohexadiene-1-carboxylate synthase [Bacillus tuaregi]|uniref:2-succinyl-6-hydroxy-2, 4-cyclohexadiene-1-carboxylate synthase n=1 Tax=Bacillus tuaregi TaxID=1816695 RepID=UPI0008F8B8FC|nr:2-succinyl-6-hydroxy-2,4-cyclohexadiene-1-carboxylate synthase [Bacillus tuaregi]
MNVTIDGILYHVDTIGKGFPLLLLHGFTGDSTTWKPFLSQWSQEHQVITVDIIGHGKSASPIEVERYDIQSVAKDIKGILEHLGIEQANVLGYSMGGRLALSFSLLYPQFVYKLILESASPGLETKQEQDNRRIQDTNLSQFIRKNGIERFVDYWENIPLFHTQKKLSLHMQQEIRKQRFENSVIGLSNSLLGMGTGAQPSWWNRLQELKAETLLLTGEQDQKFCFIAEKMVKKMKHAKWQKFNECGHAIHVEQPEKFGTIVSVFLSN